jgi:hypothetical protein
VIDDVLPDPVSVPISGGEHGEDEGVDGFEGKLRVERRR